MVWAGLGYLQFEYEPNLTMAIWEKSQNPQNNLIWLFSGQNDKIVGHLIKFYYKTAPKNIFWDIFYLNKTTGTHQKA